MSGSSESSVLLPSEITLLSNNNKHFVTNLEVLLPSEITLLSNAIMPNLNEKAVLLPSEITLLSNYESCRLYMYEFYYPLK